MKLGYVGISIFLSIALQAATLQDAPKIKERIMPSGTNQEVVYSYYDALKDAKKGVVNISTQKKVKGVDMMRANPFMNDPFFRQFFGDAFGNLIPKDRIERSLGSGVVISNEGHIITNNHVINDADTIIVTLPGSTKEHKATVIGKDAKSDLAVIKIDNKDVAPLRFADSGDVREGDVVFAIGNPFGVGETITQGIVSALNKSGIGINDYENFIQTDASINPGNSGGALVDSRGALVGINTAILSKSGGNHGVGFAIPSNMVKKIAMQLIDSGKVERGFMGISIQDLTDEYATEYGKEGGALIIGLSVDSPASKAGLEVWDIVTEIEGQKIKDAADLKNKVGTYAPGEKINVKYIRDGKERTTTIKLTAYDDEGSASEGGSSEGGGVQGLSLLEMSDLFKQKYQIPQNISGVFVSDVKENSEAQKIGFAPQDIIIRVEGYEIKSIEDFKKAIKSYKGKTIRILVNRGGVILPLIKR